MELRRLWDDWFYQLKLDCQELFDQLDLKYRDFFMYLPPSPNTWKYDSHFKLNLFFTYDYVVKTYQVQSKLDLTIFELWAKQYPDQIFLVFHNLPNLSKSTTSNLIFINWGSDWLFQYGEYLKITPLTKKTYNSQHWISLNYKPRPHRLITAMMLMGKNLDTNGLIRISPHTINEYSSWHHLTSNIEIEPNMARVLDLGFKKLINLQHGGHPDGNFMKNLRDYADNSENFTKNLTKLYKDKTVEIVNETMSCPEFLITEKTLNCFLGYNLPLFVSGPGAVAYLRKLGFDMFDHILNHDYDLEQDTILRVNQMLDDNREILSNSKLAWHHWNSCQDRLAHNAQHIKSIGNFYRKNTLDMVKQILSNFKKYEMVSQEGFEP